jgi:hypothetical protein
VAKPNVPSQRPLLSQSPKDDPPQLVRLGREILEHWRVHRPRMYADLKRQGELEAAALDAQERTVGALVDLLHKGVPYPQAWELVREEWAFLPSEEDVPALGEGSPAR